MKLTPHVWTKSKNKYISYLKFVFYGLLRLNNAGTHKAVKLGREKD